jgi:predicted nucleic acid-binding protein
MILIDSDVLIWLTRGHSGAMARLGQLNPWRISTITYLELAQGCRSREELLRAKRGLAAQQTQILPVNASISE